MSELYRGPWGPVRTNPEPRNLTEDGALADLMAHGEELVGTVVVITETPDPVLPGTRLGAAWFDEEGRRVAWLTNERVEAATWIEDLRVRGEQVLGVKIARPPLRP